MMKKNKDITKQSYVKDRKSMCRQNKPIFWPPCEKLLDTCKAFPGETRVLVISTIQNTFWLRRAAEFIHMLEGSNLEYKWI